jgi:hemolysin III
MSSRFREPVNGWMHFGAAILALLGLVLLLVLGWQDSHGRFQPLRAASLLIYGLSLVLLFSASAAYHLTRARPSVLLWLRKLDHAAIYLLIAGTYTPICLNLMSGFWKWGMLALVWGLALTGIAAKLLYIKTPRWFSTLLYVILGWLGVIGLRAMLVSIPPAGLAWLAAGGVIFTLGALVYATKKLDFFPGVFGFHEVWHIFVILGALAQFIMIAFYIAL